MPKIDQPKKVKKTKKAAKLVALKPTKKTNLPVAPKSTKRKSTPEYYQCLLTQAQQNWSDPVSGKKKKITACCKECKTNAPKLVAQRGQEIKKLITSYQQVGDSLKRLLQPIK